MGQIVSIPEYVGSPTISTLQTLGIKVYDYTHQNSGVTNLYFLASKSGAKVAAILDGIYARFYVGCPDDGFTIYSNSDDNSRVVVQSVELTEVGNLYYYKAGRGLLYNNGAFSNCSFPYQYYNSNSEADSALAEEIGRYSSIPITYNATNCTMSGPTEASGGTEVVVNVTPSSGYILRSSGVSVIDSTGVTVPHIVQGNQIAFTMPYAP